MFVLDTKNGSHVLCLLDISGELPNYLPLCYNVCFDRCFRWM